MTVRVWLEPVFVGRGGWPFPTRHDLDQITTKHPVILREKSGHAAVANSAALARTGLDKNTLQPGGGELVHDTSGELTGLLFEGPAISLVTGQIDPPTETELDQAVWDGAHHGPAALNTAPVPGAARIWNRRWRSA